MSSSTGHWKPIDLPVLRAIELTTAGFELSRADWPYWAATSTQFSRFKAFPASVGLAPRSTAPSEGIVGALLAERIDAKDYPSLYNYGLYLIAETTDGHLFQSPPI